METYIFAEDVRAAVRQAIMTMLSPRNKYGNPLENAAVKSSGQAQTEDGKERERAFSDRAVLIGKSKLSRLKSEET